MSIKGLENNYYLAFNDIWIIIDGFTKPVSLLEITVMNLTTGVSLPVFKLSPSPVNDFEFNICIPVKYLFPTTDHVNVNSLQSFKIDFKAKFHDTTIAEDNSSVTKYFVRGGRNKASNNQWYLSASQELIIGQWIEWRGITLPGNPKKIQGNSIVSYTPSSSFKMFTDAHCDYRILKFLNSIGGYQFFVFEKFQIKNKTKAGKTIPRKTNHLQADNFTHSSIENEKNIAFQTLTPFEIQDVFTELVNSPEVFLFSPDGPDSMDNESKWERLQVENNESIENNWTRKYENKIEFSFSNYIKKAL